MDSNPKLKVAELTFVRINDLAAPPDEAARAGQVALPEAQRCSRHRSGISSHDSGSRWAVVRVYLHAACPVETAAMLNHREAHKASKSEPVKRDRNVNPGPYKAC